MNFKKIFFLLLGVVLLSGMTGLNAQDKSEKPRVIVTTDGEVDDRSSMIRFFLYSCDFDVEGIVQVNSRFQKDGHSDKKWIEAQLDAYEQVLPNLRKHNPHYPDANTLRSVMRVGNENRNDLYVAPPDMATKNTAGAQLIIDKLLDDDPRPVHVLSWGGANTTASALWKLKTEYPKEKFEYAASRIRIYCIWYQDGGGKWIQENIPEAYINEAYRWDNVWDYESYDGGRGRGKSSNPPFVQEYMKPDWLNANVKTGHGPLGAMTPQRYISEGDTPSFLHLVNNGLESHVDYTLGGWGGRSAYDDQAYPNHITDKDLEEDGDRNKMYWRWVPAAQNDFAARMDWCVKEFKDANHAPVAKVKGALVRDVKPGETVKLAATATDPDGNQLTYKWWQYADADCARATVAIANSASLDNASFVAPNKPGKQVHIILEVTDNGTPPLTGYQRVICNIKSTSDASTEVNPTMPSINRASAPVNQTEPAAGAPYSPHPEKVVVTKVKHFDNMCWKIATAGGTWYFENGETEGKSGFSSAFDLVGNDWIGNDADKGYNKSPSKGGRREYRGWPNFGEGNFDHPQRTSGTSTRWVDAGGKEIPFADKLEGDHLIMRSANANYELEYHFFPTHAAIKVLKANGKYAFLFEGPIGGEQEASVEKDYYVLKDGKPRECKAGGLGYLEPEFGNKFPSPFFYLVDSDPKDTQVLYVGVKNAGPETAGDEGWRQGENMVIFSYGRDQDKRAYTGTNAVCVFGFYPKAAGHEAISAFIESRLAAPFSRATTSSNEP